MSVPSGTANVDCPKVSSWAGYSLIHRCCLFPQGRSVCVMSKVTLRLVAVVAVRDADHRATGCWCHSPGKGVLWSLSLYLLGTPRWLAGLLLGQSGNPYLLEALLR